MKSTTQERKSYDHKDWLKFLIPMATSSTAMLLCGRFVIDPKALIRVSGISFGVFSYCQDESSCRFYRNADDSIPQDPQLLAAQIGSTFVVSLGFLLWLCLVLSPCWRKPNQIWPKLISICAAVVIGNVQLFAVAKFIRFLLTAYPDEDVFYRSRLFVVSSIVFWFLTAVAIAVCAVRPPSPYSSKPLDAGHPNLVTSASGETKETRDEIPHELNQTLSTDTKEFHEIEKGTLRIYDAASDRIRGVEAIELSLSEPCGPTTSEF